MPLPSPIPSRSAMLAASQGDPFLGALLPALGGLVAKGVGKLAGFIGRIGGKKVATATAAAKPLSRTAAISQVREIGGRILTRAKPFLPAVGAGVAAAAAGSVLEGILGPDGVPRARRRRMNPLNPKALRRATRRLSSFNKMAKKTQSELAKLAPPRPRRARHHDDHHHHHK